MGPLPLSSRSMTPRKEIPNKTAPKTNERAFRIIMELKIKHYKCKERFRNLGYIGEVIVIRLPGNLQELALLLGVVIGSAQCRDADPLETPVCEG